MSASDRLWMLGDDDAPGPPSQDVFGYTSTGRTGLPSPETLKYSSDPDTFKKANRDAIQSTERGRPPPPTYDTETAAKILRQERARQVRQSGTEGPGKDLESVFADVSDAERRVQDASLKAGDRMKEVYRDAHPQSRGTLGDDEAKPRSAARRKAQAAFMQRRAVVRSRPEQVALNRARFQAYKARQKKQLELARAKGQRLLAERRAKQAAPSQFDASKTMT